MELKDFISKLPIDKIAKVEITQNRIVLPTNIDATSFYNDFKTNIKSPTLTDEKAIYACATIEKSKYISSIDLLNSELRFAK